MDRTEMRIEQLRVFFAADGVNVDLACELADAEFAVGNSGAARATLLSLPETTRTAINVQIRLGRIALAQGDYSAAEITYRDLVESRSDSLTLWHDLAFCQICQRNVKAALSTLSAAYDRFGLDVSLLILDARIAMMRGDFDQALVSLDQALALQPSDATAAGVKALALLDAGRLGEAEQAIRTALTTTPKQHEALLVAGTLALWRQDFEGARQVFEHALQSHPSSGRALSGYGQALMCGDDLVRACSILERAVAAMPDHIGTWHALAWTHLLLGDVEAARSSYECAYELDRNFADNHGGLALIAVLQGKFDQAEQSIRRATRLDPEAVTARYAKALLLEARGDVAGFETLLRELISISGRSDLLPVTELSTRLKARFRSQLQ